MLKEILDNLDSNKRKQLMYAFEHEFSQLVELEDNKFLGVNVSNLKHLEPIETVSNWTYGRIKK